MTDTKMVGSDYAVSVFHVASFGSNEVVRHLVPFLLNEVLDYIEKEGRSIDIDTLSITIRPGEPLTLDHVVSVRAETKPR